MAFRVPSPGTPAALTSDAAHLYVGTDNRGPAPSRLVVFRRTGDVARKLVIVGQLPHRTGGLSAAAMRGADVLATDLSRGRLLRINPRTGRQKVLSTLPNLPPCLIGILGVCQPGLRDLPPVPEGLVATKRYAYIADAGQDTIWRYTFLTGQLAAWYMSGDFASGDGPTGLAVDRGGDLVFTATTTTEPLAPLTSGLLGAGQLNDALYRLEVASDGSPGSRTALARFTGDAGPGPVAIGRSGDIYVGLRGKGGVVRIRPNGRVRPLPGAAPSLLPAPGGLCVGDGVLYVADAGRPATAASGRVKAVRVNDKAMRPTRHRRLSSGYDVGRARGAPVGSPGWR